VAKCSDASVDVERFQCLERSYLMVVCLHLQTSRGVSEWKHE